MPLFSLQKFAISHGKGHTTPPYEIGKLRRIRHISNSAAPPILDSNYRLCTAPSCTKTSYLPGTCGTKTTSPTVGRVCGIQQSLIFLRNRARRRYRGLITGSGTAVVIPPAEEPHVDSTHQSPVLEHEDQDHDPHAGDLRRALLGRVAARVGADDHFDGGAW